MSGAPQISRSLGIDTGYMGIRAGAGYSGSSAGLDDTVKAAAQLLADRFGLDVEIRFNSDRMSGGAFVVMRGAEVGITAKLWDLRPDGASRRYVERYGEGDGETWTAFCSARGLAPAGPDYQITVAVYLGTGVARPAFANCPDGRGGFYGSHAAADIAAALALIEKGADIET